MILYCKGFIAILFLGYLKVSPSANPVEARSAINYLKLPEVVSLNQDAKWVAVRLADSKLTLHYEQYTVHV